MGASPSASASLEEDETEAEGQRGGQDGSTSDPFSSGARVNFPDFAALRHDAEMDARDSEDRSNVPVDPMPMR
jgi:hypothetical protein